MKLAVFGATGQTGLQIVGQALARGHEVNALVRDESRLAEFQGRLQQVHGDMLDEDALDRLMRLPTDAVISALGIFHREPCTDLSDGTALIIDRMHRQGIRKLGVVSSLGVGDSRGQGNFVARLIQKYSLSHVLDDKERQEALVRDSGLDWTIVRPPRLTNRPELRGGLVAWQGDTPRGPKFTWSVPRAVVARWLLDAIETGQYRNAAVNLSDSK